MRIKNLFIIPAGVLLFLCGCGPEPPGNVWVPTNATLKEPGDHTGIAVKVDDSKGKGRFTTVALTHPLDKAMITGGKTIYDVKCGACHKLNDDKLVGPGWKGVTDRRKPEWIMNFITNTDEMMDKDPSAQAMLEKCIVRMPNQHVSDGDARKLLEFMRKNDGKN
jgi:cytochrome c551/c552